MGARRLESAISALLVLSGAAALLHETAWFRLLVPVLGAGVAPAAAVSAGALLGLALGAALGGRLADRWRNPVRTLAAAEAAAALLGALVPIVLEAALAGVETPRGAILAALLLAVPAVPMGASLPAALRALAPARDRVAPSFRRLYAWNTVGAVLGVAIGVAWLLEALGTRASVAVACAMQVAAALGAVALARRPEPAEDDAPPSSAPARTPRPLAAAAFLAGAAGLVLQIAWTRRLTPVVGNTTQVFAVVLAVQLLGLALGSLLLGPRRSSRPRSVVVGLALGAAALAALAPLLVAAVADRVADASARAAGDGLALLGISAVAAAVLVLPATALGAAVLPWLLRAAWPDPDEAGSASGRLLAANTIGAAAGALATALAWLPAAGSAATLRGAAALYLAAAAVAAAGWRTRPRVLLAALAVVLLAQPFVAPLSDAAGRDAIGAYYARGAWAPEDALPVSFEEGAVSTVVVRDREGVTELWVDGSFEASTLPADLLHLGLLGHLPAALLAGRGVDAPRASVIGLGAGLTSRALAAWSPRDLSVHEIEPAVARAAVAFADGGGGVPAVARLSFGDGRRGLEHDPAPRDLVTSDPVHPAVAGSAWLYSLDHYRRVAAVLSDDGVACQWLPLYETVPYDLRLVVRTFSTAFPHSCLFLAGYDGILVGAKRPLRLSEARLRAALAGSAGLPLAALGMRAPGRLLGLVAMDSDACRRFGGSGPLNTDDRLLLEFRAGRNRWSGDPAKNLRLLAAERPDPASLLDAPPSDAFRTEVAAARSFDDGLRAWSLGSWARAVAVFEERTAADPADDVSRRLLTSSLVGAARADLEEGRTAEAVAVARAVLARPDVEPALRLAAAEVLAAAGARDEARAVARDVLRSRAWPRARRLAAE